MTDFLLIVLAVELGILTLFMGLTLCVMIYAVVEMSKPMYLSLDQLKGKTDSSKGAQAPPGQYV